MTNTIIAVYLCPCLSLSATSAALWFVSLWFSEAAPGDWATKKLEVQIPHVAPTRGGGAWGITLIGTKCAVISDSVRYHTDCGIDFITMTI